MADHSLDRTLEDLIETVKVIARYFDADQVFIIGSQSILLSWPDAPVLMRTSSEIDAYPGNAKLWEITQKQLDPDDDPEASEEIATLYGEGSAFHKQHGFYIDGVDENTASLPRQWQQRCIQRPVDVDGKQVLAVAPSPEDIIVSKLARLVDKDKEFILAYHQERPLDKNLILQRLDDTDLDAAITDRARVFIQALD